jgi:prepilin-type processing-associated H-X9-DG protein
LPVRYATTPDFLFDSKTFTRDDGKPLIVDGKVPMIFVDGHVELVEIKRYTNVNYDEIVSR